MKHISEFRASGPRRALQLVVLEKANELYVCVCVCVYVYVCVRVPDLVAPEEADELVDLLPRDAVHDFAVVADQLDDHLRHVQPDVALQRRAHSRTTRGR